MTIHRFMKYALDAAEYALKQDEVPVGAVVVDYRRGKVIAAAGNETEHKKNPLLHAELIAIAEACQKKGSGRLTDCDIYVTLEPCPMCAQAISFARFRRLYFGAYDSKGGGVDHGPRIFSSSSCHHNPEVYGGILEEECGELLRKFFKGKRRRP